MRLAVALVVTALAAGPQPTAAQRIDITRTAIASGQEPLQLTDFVFLPGGGVLTAGKDGLVVSMSADGERAVLADIPVYDEADLGLVGLELAPDFRASGAVYTSYTYASDDAVFSRLSRWRVEPIDRPTRFLDEKVILDRIPQDAPFHSIGSVLPAGKTLFVGVGDGTRPLVDLRSLRAQDPRSPNGKLLRITPDGEGVPGNPFFEPSDPSSWQSRVYAMGLRNPFRFTLRPGNGSLYASDVGWRTFEEINVVEAGDNFGWPCWEGPERSHETIGKLNQCKRIYRETPSIQDPLFSYAWGDAAAAIIGGVFAPMHYPPGIRGGYLFGDFVRGEIRVILVDGSNRLLGDASRRVLADAGGPVRFRIGPDGLVYYADIIEGTIWRLDAGTDGRPAGDPVTAVAAALAVLAAVTHRRRTR